MILEAPISSEPLMPVKLVVQQAPPSYIDTDVPVTAIGVIGQPVGTVTNSLNIDWTKTNLRDVPPRVATLGKNQVDTTSKQNPDSPAPTPPVGTFPKPSGVMPIGANTVAPTAQNTKRTLGIVVAVILLAWFFLGFSFRGVL